MAHVEEQQLELEALESLYSNEGEFKRFSCTEFQLHLTAYANGDGAAGGDAHVVLHIRYTERYPDVPPEWSLLSSEGVERVKEEELKSILETTVNQSLGYPMVYTMAEAVQSFLSENCNHTTQKEAAPDDTSQEESNSVAEAEECDSAADAEDQYRGPELKDLCDVTSRITKEQFFRWKSKFFQEMVDRGLWVAKKRTDKLTGKQMFERDHSLVKTAIMEEDGKAELCTPDHTPAPTSQVIWMDDQLFTGKDTDSLDADAFSSDDDTVDHQQGQH